MQEKMTESYEELKRVEHLIYVSLKYTRTVDVILNILNRMVDGYALMVDALILYEKDRGNIIQEPESAMERAAIVRQVFSADDVVVDNIELYLLLRKLLHAKNVERENEYRRHVTMKTVIDGREEIVNIDIITNYCLYQREFFNHVRNIIEGKATVQEERQSVVAPQAPSWMDEPKRDQDEEVEDEIRRETRTSPTPPTRQPLKVRPVSAPPRKRAPRPKKYKIQIPKNKNAYIQTAYMPALRAAMEEERRKKEEAAAKAKRKPVAKPISKPSAKQKPKSPAKQKQRPSAKQKRKR